jgi:hypothetical protein
MSKPSAESDGKWKDSGLKWVKRVKQVKRVFKAMESGRS